MEWTTSNPVMMLTATCLSCGEMFLVILKQDGERVSKYCGECRANIYAHRGERRVVAGWRNDANRNHDGRRMVGNLW
jgi:hypothetical protein